MTALEWLEQSIANQSLLVFMHVQELGFFEQAKQIEKEQIMDSYIMGSCEMARKEFNPEKYYNEIYKK